MNSLPKAQIQYCLLCILIFCSQMVFAQGPASSQGAERTEIEGVLSQVSTLPPPGINPYPDCYYTAIIDIDHIVSGQSIPKKVILVLPGFFDRQYAPEAKYKVGDKVKASVVPFASMPDKVRQTQQADEIEDVDLDFYFPEKIAQIRDFQQVASPVPFSGSTQRTSEPAKVQRSDGKARSARQDAMRRDLEQIDKLLAEHGGDWDRWYDSLKDFRDRYKKQYDAKAQRWIGDSFFSAGQMEYGKGYSPEFVKSVVAFKNYLAARNVDLILVRVPQKGEVVDDLFTPAAQNQVSNPYLLRLYKELLHADVEIITDVVPRAKEARLKYPLMYWYQSFAEEHPAEGTSWVVAEAVAQRLNRYETIRNAAKAALSLQQVALPANSFHWPEGNAKFNPAEPVRFSSVCRANSTLRLEQGIDSPVVVVGSSFIGSPSMEQAGSIPAYLAYLTGVVPDIMYRNGSNAIIPRTIAREGDRFLENRSVVVFPFVPWAIHGPLDSPPVVDPSKSKKVQLASYTGNDLKNSIQPAPGTPEHVFKYSSEGTLSVQARDRGSRTGGRFRLALPQKISDFPYFMIEIGGQNKDVAVIKASYGTQTDTVHKSLSQTNLEEILVFKSSSDYEVEFDINNIHPDVATIIKSIRIYGLQP